MAQQWSDLSVAQKAAAVGGGVVAGGIGLGTLALISGIAWLATPGLMGARAGSAQEKRIGATAAIAAPLTFVALTAAMAKFAPPMSPEERDRVMSKPPWQR